MTHPLSIQPPGWDSPPEPSRQQIQDDIEEHVKRYHNAKADKEGCLETIKESEETMQSVVDYLSNEYDMSEDDINDQQ